jgi:hypothetical protein
MPQSQHSPAVPPIAIDTPHMDAFGKVAVFKVNHLEQSLSQENPSGSKGLS